MTAVIIADDNPRDRAFLSEILHCYAPVPAANAQEALDACEGNTEINIVTDIQMPEINGIELARHIWRHHSDARILFWSQHSDEAYVRALSKIVPPETVYGYALKNNPADTIKQAARTVFEYNQCWVDPSLRPVQARSQHKYEALSDAEYEVLIDIALGLTDLTIAERRHLSRRGVQNRLQSLYTKLGANLGTSEPGACESFNIRARAVSLALQRGLINAYEIKREEQLLAQWLDSK